MRGIISWTLLQKDLSSALILGIIRELLERAGVAETTALEEVQLDASFYYAEALCNPVTSYIFCQSSVDVVFVAKVGESIGRWVLYDSAAVWFAI